MKKILAIIAACGIAGCTTPYANEGITGGISQADLGNGEIEIKFVGNDWTSYDAMENMWRRKASEIAATALC
jgi:hypothetical protein